MYKFLLGTDGSWLGVETTEVTQQKASDLKLPAEHGAVVGKVLPDSPAAKAGLKENDVITEINGQRVEGTAQFRRMIHEIPAGRSRTTNRMARGPITNNQCHAGKIGSPSWPRNDEWARRGGIRSFECQIFLEMPEAAGLGDLNEFIDVDRGSLALGDQCRGLAGRFRKLLRRARGRGRADSRCLCGLTSR